MLDFFKSEIVYEAEVLNVEGEKIIVETDLILPHDEAVKLKDSFGNMSKSMISHSRRTSVGRWLNFGVLSNGTLKPTPGSRHGSLRRWPRLQIGIRARSQELPGFSALTRDLCLYGVQLIVESPLSVGQTISLTLDLDDDLGPLHVEAYIRWCKMTTPGLAGLQFTELAPEQAARLKHYLAARSQPDEVIPRLTESLSAVTQTETTVLTAAYLRDAYLEEDRLVIQLEEEHEIIEFRFLAPTVHHSKVEPGPLSALRTEALTDDLIKFTFYNDEGVLILELDALSPELLVMTAQKSAHDLSGSGRNGRSRLLDEGGLGT